jgi:hypothetical protein
MNWNERTTDPLDGARGIKYKEIILGWAAIIAIGILAVLFSGCTTTGQSAGITHGFADGGSRYHAPHYTHETERVDVGVQHYIFEDNSRGNFTEIDWTVKF